MVDGTKGKQIHHDKRRFISIALALILGLLVFILSACGSDDSDFYPQYSGSNYESEPGFNEDDNDSQTSFLDESMTVERAGEIYDVFVNASYEDFIGISDEEATAEWESYDADVRALMYQQFSEIAPKLGLSAKCSESEWIEDMDYYKSGNLFFRALISLHLDNDKYLSYLQSVYSYQKGLEGEKYEPLDDKILAAADNLVVEYYTGSYLLCTGGDHNIQHMTYDWTVEEDSFAVSGTVTAAKTDDIFTDEKVSYSINGQNGIFENAIFGSTDFLPIFKGIGAIDENGTFLAEQIDICAVNVFDAEILYILSQEELGVITIAVVEYDKAASKYVWDEQTYTSRSRCCFNKDYAFCYVDIKGDFCSLTRTDFDPN